MTDTLIVLPTIGANVEKAAAALRALEAAGPTDTITTFWAGAPAHLKQSPRGSEIFLPIDEYDDPGSLPCPGRMTWSLSATRRGLVPAYRVGFARFAAGRWSRLVLLEDNVLVTPGWFDALSRTLDAHPEFGWVACGQLENAHAPFTSLCSMLTREAALALDGGPDLAFAPCQFDDGDMFMRLLAKGFTPHAVDHKVSHPEARTSREGTEADDWALIEAHRVTFMQRWGIADFPWDRVPVHRRCEQCRS